LNAKHLYRTASILLFLFAAAHTYGFLAFQPPTPQAAAVRDAMRVPFQVGSASFSYGGFYVGFGLFVTVAMLFWAYLAWRLGTLAATNPQVIGSLGWVFFATQVAAFVLSAIYFAAPPAISAALVAACLGWAAVLVNR
jgi:hypothetical protein